MQPEALRDAMSGRGKGQTPAAHNPATTPSRRSVRRALPSDLLAALLEWRRMMAAYGRTGHISAEWAGRWKDLRAAERRLLKATANLE